MRAQYQRRVRFAKRSATVTGLLLLLAIAPIAGGIAIAYAVLSHLAHVGREELRTRQGRQEAEAWLRDHYL